MGQKQPHGINYYNDSNLQEAWKAEQKTLIPLVHQLPFSELYEAIAFFPFIFLP